MLYFALRIIKLVSYLFQICIAIMHYFIKGKDPELEFSVKSKAFFCLFGELNFLSKENR